MKPRDIFGLVVRLFGLIFLYQGLAAVPMAVSAFCPLFPHFVFRNLYPSSIMVAWPLLVAYWMLRGAPLLMRLAYDSDEGEGDS